jgi:hypothetical protein
MRLSKLIWCRTFSVMSAILIAPLIFCSGCKKTVEEKREHGWFSFVISDSDTTHNVVDMSFLNKDIAGSSGFVKTENGHYQTGSC